MAGRSSFGFLGRFGRSGDLKALDEGLRACDVHPAQMADGVKLAAVRIVQKHSPADSLPDAAYHQAAALIGFCIQGEEKLAAMQGSEAAAQLSDRVSAALEQPQSADAELILLALHAGLVSPTVLETFDLAVEER